MSDKSETFQSKTAFTINRAMNFLKYIVRNKRAVMGIGILIFYITIALAAPLLTRNDPAQGYYVSSDYAMPVWLRYLPGGTIVAEDVNPVNTPSFSATSMTEWNFNSTETTKATTTLEYSSDEGRPTSLGGSGPGSASIVFRRVNDQISAGNIKAHITKEFNYPYQSSPKRFTANVTIYVKGAENVPVDIRFFIANSSGHKFNIWIPPTITASTLSWLVPPKPLDSYEAALKEQFEKMPGGYIGIDPAAVIFNKQASYKFGVEVTYRDSGYTRLGTDVTVYIDDLDIRLYGNAYGLLGTDYTGRDLFAQLVYGARISLFVGLLSALLSVVIGLFVGLVSGYVGKATDEVIMRLTDALLVLPGLPLLLVLVAILGPSIWNLIMVIGVLGWMGFARTVRSQTLSLKERSFIEAARSVGAGKWHVIATHILPNVMSLVYVSLALSVPSAILSEAALSWLGLFDPSVISWGRMLHDAQEFQGVDKWWWIVPPGISIMLVSLSFVLIGYALDEILNPKLRQRR